MQQQTIKVEPSVQVLCQSLDGDLRVAGWERNEVMVKTNGDGLNVRENEGQILISCDDDLIIYMPSLAGLGCEEVSGDASLQALKGAVKLVNISGDLTIRDVQETELGSCSGDVTLSRIGHFKAGSISGDLNLRDASGDCLVASTNGDVSLRNVGGEVRLDSVNSDVYIRNVKGPVHAIAQGDAALNLEPVEGQEYRLDAAGDMIIHLPTNANVDLHLAANEFENIRVDFPDVKLEEDSPTQKIVLGTGGSNLFLSAEGDLVVTSRADQWDSAADFGVGMLDGMMDGFTIPPIPPINIPMDLNERINNRVKQALERAQLRTEGLSRRAEERVSAAMRRADAKARAAEVRARRMHASGRINMGGTDMFSFNADKKPESQPVSDDERLIILRMLQEKKISLADAEKLLETLEGKGAGQ